MNLEEFIQSIEGDYLFLLYQKYNNIFPGCCHEASNLLCGFVQLFFDESFRHRYVSDAPYPHSYISNDNGFIIDFTSFQYLPNKNYVHMEKEQLLAIARECACFPVSQSYIYVKNMVSEKSINNWFKVLDIPCFYIVDPNQIKNNYSPSEFIRYCEDYATEIGKKVCTYISSLQGECKFS